MMEANNYPEYRTVPGEESWGRDIAKKRMMWWLERASVGEVNMHLFRHPDNTLAYWVASTKGSELAEFTLNAGIQEAKKRGVPPELLEQALTPITSDQAQEEWEKLIHLPDER